MYSLVNIATVVRDLARHPRAGQVATELLRAFALGPEELADLDRTVDPGGDRARRRAEVLADDAARPRSLQVLSAARVFADDMGLDAWSAAVDVLERSAIGGLDDLRVLVRRDVLADAWSTGPDLAVAAFPRALDVVCDGVVGVHVDDPVLASAWLRWADSHAIVPQPTGWPHLVDAVRALRRDADVPPAPAQWALRMHDACWAVHLTGRERVAAVTQLHALRALAEVWAPEAPPLRVVAMTSAAVHATVVADVLDAATVAAMSQPLFSASSGALP